MVDERNEESVDSESFWDKGPGLWLSNVGAVMGVCVCPFASPIALYMLPCPWNAIVGVPLAAIAGWSWWEIASAPGWDGP